MTNGETGFTGAALEVWTAVRGLNDAWTKYADINKLKTYFHPNMVAIVPTVAQRLEGADVCAAGWEGFTKAFRVKEWKELDPSVQLYAGDACAVVTYYYELAAEADGAAYNFSGRDMFFLVRENGVWRVVADQFSGYPASRE